MLVSLSLKNEPKTKFVFAAADNFARVQLREIPGITEQVDHNIISYCTTQYIRNIANIRNTFKNITMINLESNTIPCMIDRLRKINFYMESKIIVSDMTIICKQGLQNLVAVVLIL